MLDLIDIRKTFNPKTINAKVALNGLNLHLDDGDFVTVIGGNGAGKSTMLNAISGTWPVDEGKIMIDGQDVTHLSEHKRALMLGRGLIGNPALAQTLKGGAPITKETFIAFHDALMQAHAEFHPRNVVFGRMKEFMKYAVCSFENFEKPRKRLRKAANMDAYLDAVHQLFDEYEISETPGYEP